MFYMTNELAVSRMRYFLDKNKMTPYQLDKTGMIPKTTLYAVLKGDREASGDVIKKFCMALGISLDEFCGEMQDVAVYTEDQQKLIDIIRVAGKEQIAEILAYASGNITE